MTTETKKCRCGRDTIDDDNDWCYVDSNSDEYMAHVHAMDEIERQDKIKAHKMRMNKVRRIPSRRCTVCGGTLDKDGRCPACEE